MPRAIRCAPVRAPRCGGELPMQQMFPLTAYRQWPGRPLQFAYRAIGRFDSLYSQAIPGGGADLETAYPSKILVPKFCHHRILNIVSDTPILRRVPDTRF